MFSNICSSVIEINEMSIKEFFSLIGIILAGLLIIPVGMKVIDLLKHKNNFKYFSKDYYEDLIEVPIKVTLHDNDKRLSLTGGYESVSHTIRYSAKAGRDDSEYISENYKIFLDVKSKKYFKIIMIVPRFDMAANDYFVAMKGRDSLRVFVNSIEYRDTNIGTIDNPYLAFGARGAIDPLRWKDIVAGKSYNVDITEKQLKYNAEIYWTYIASKEEFE